MEAVSVLSSVRLHSGRLLNAVELIKERSPVSYRGPAVHDPQPGDYGRLETLEPSQVINHDRMDWDPLVSIAFGALHAAPVSPSAPSIGAFFLRGSHSPTPLPLR